MFFFQINSKFYSIHYLSCSFLNISRWYISKHVHTARQQASYKSTSDENDKILKVAIIGEPNAGKSTLINQLVGRCIFAVSRKVHTTRCIARGVLISYQTQVIFLDTPGLVSLNESEKHHLENSFLVDSEEAVKEADVVGVIHDVSNTFTRHRLSSKIDTMQRKRDLLELTKRLTNDKLSMNVESDSFTQSQFQEIIDRKSGWPNFESIFMVSALNGDGVGDIKMYLLNSAMSGQWLFDKTTITDQNDVTVVENVVFSKLLEYLPNVVPYSLKATVEYLSRSQDGIDVDDLVTMRYENAAM